MTPGIVLAVVAVLAVVWLLAKRDGKKNNPPSGGGAGPIGPGTGPRPDVENPTSEK